jgi:hypothetical protein
MPDEGTEETIIVSSSSPSDFLNAVSDGRNYFYINVAENSYIYFKGQKNQQIFADCDVTYESMKYADATIYTDENTETMISKIDERVVQIDGLSKEYKIVVINDLHLIIPDDEVGEEYEETVEDRYTSMMVDAFGTPSSEKWEKMAEEIDALDADLVVFAGDILDYASSANFACLENGMQKISAPIIYLRSDHDYSLHYTSEALASDEVVSMHQEIDGDPDLWSVDMGEFKVLGINKSWTALSDETIDKITEALNGTTPVILATHVPFDSPLDSNFRATCYQVRNIYNMWGIGDRYVPNEAMTQLMNTIYTGDNALQAVIAGHLHFGYDVNLADDVREYVFAPAYAGNVGVIYLEP